MLAAAEELCTRAAARCHFQLSAFAEASATNQTEGCLKNENARSRSPWRLHIVSILRSVDCRVPQLAPAANPNSLRISAFGSRQGRSPLRIETWSFSSSTGGQRPAFAVRRSFRFDRLVTLWLAPERSIFRLGLSIGIRLSPFANPSAHVSESSCWLSPALPSSAAPGWQPPRSRGTAHLPARLAVSFRLRPDFHRRLAPPVSIRSPLSSHPRNSISGDFRSSSAFSSAKQCQRFNLRLAPQVKISGLAVGIFSGFHRPSTFPSHSGDPVSLPCWIIS
jgi:hypothetical protein